MLGVRMRKTVRGLSDDWQAHSIDLAHQRVL
jgi:hypothetical protein